MLDHRRPSACPAWPQQGQSWLRHTDSDVLGQDFAPCAVPLAVTNGCCPICPEPGTAQPKEWEEERQPREIPATDRGAGCSCLVSCPFFCQGSASSPTSSRNCLKNKHRSSQELNNSEAGLFLEELQELQEVALELPAPPGLHRIETKLGAGAGGAGAALVA